MVCTGEGNFDFSKKKGMKAYSSWPCKTDLTKKIEVSCALQELINASKVHQRSIVVSS
jgi:hypothetical protein